MPDISDAVYLVDAMSSFGAVPVDIEKSHIDIIVSSANKCLQGVPGFAFVLARKSILDKCEGQLDTECTVMTILLSRWVGVLS